MPETLVVQAELAELVQVGDWAGEVAQRMCLPDSTLFALRLCFEEAVSNIVRYGFPDGQPATPPNKNVRLALVREDDRLTATIEDHGAAFDPREVAPPKAAVSIDDVVIGGLGIHLMRQFSQGLAYERRDGINRLTLRFDLAAAGG